MQKATTTASAVAEAEAEAESESLKDSGQKLEVRGQSTRPTTKMATRGNSKEGRSR